MAVVGDVAVDHEQVVVTDGRQAAALAGAAVKGGELANGVAIAHLQPHGLARELEVLRIHAQADAGIDAILGADDRRTVDLDVRADLACGRRS